VVFNLKILKVAVYKKGETVETASHTFSMYRGSDVPGGMDISNS